MIRIDVTTHCNDLTIASNQSPRLGRARCGASASGNRLGTHEVLQSEY